MSKSFGLIVPSQLAGPSVKGCTDESGVLGEGCEN